MDTPYRRRWRWRWRRRRTGVNILRSLTSSSTTLYRHLSLPVEYTWMYTVRCIHSFIHSFPMDSFSSLFFFSKLSFSGGSFCPHRIEQQQQSIATFFQVFSFSSVNHRWWDLLFFPTLVSSICACVAYRLTTGIGLKKVVDKFIFKPKECRSEPLSRCISFGMIIL